MNKFGAGNKRHYFTFKENVTPKHWMPSDVSPTTSGREKRSIVYEPPPVLANRKFNTMPYNEFVACKQSYASAIEPMNYDEWENEEPNNNEYEMDVVPTNMWSGAPVTKDYQPMKKKMKIPSAVKGKQNTPNRSKFVEKSLHQSVLNVDSSKGLSFQVDPNQRKISSPSMMNFDVNGRKIFPMWSILQNKSSTETKLNLPRVFAVTIEKLQKWPKVLTGPKVIFELYGILDNVTQGSYPGSKNIILKSEGKKNRINCSFYEIDRPFPTVEKGHWQRCIVLLRSNGICQCLSIRSAKPSELKNLDKMITSSSKEKALLLRHLS